MVIGERRRSDGPAWFTGVAAERCEDDSIASIQNDLTFTACVADSIPD